MTAPSLPAAADAERLARWPVIDEDADRIGVVWVAAEERRTAVTAEPFLAAIFGFPMLQAAVTLDDVKRPFRRMGVRGCGCAAAPRRQGQ